jgi:hypothetical protein
MKKFYLLLAAILVLSLTSVMLIEKKDQQKNRSELTPDPKPLFLKGMITIKVKENVGEFDKQRGNITFNISSLDAIANSYEVNLLEKRFRYNPKKLRNDLPDLSRIYRIEFPEKYSVKKVANEFSKDPNIEYAESITVKFYLDQPNDSLYHLCQHLPQISAPKAWEIHHGEDGADVIIGIDDTGVDWKHPDLTENIWQNLGEDADGDGHTLEYIGGEWVFDPDDENGIDDDENGFTDDLIGWNFYLNSNDPMPIASTQYEFHGTHCAGIAAGRTNNSEGIASISWNLTLMPILADITDLGWNHYDALIYAAENGANIISNSWGSLRTLQAEEEVIEYVTGLGSILVAAGGNADSEILIYPACYPGVLSVAAVNVDDTKTNYSSYGPFIDICAPGGSSMGYILSTVPDGGYAGFGGTSMACPLVAGLLGLLKSYQPNWTNDQLINQLIGTADNIDSMNPQYQYKLGGGRINALHALDSTGVSVPQELKLIIKNIDPQDDNGNDILEPGEEVTLNIKFRNYVPCVGEDNVTITIGSDDPEIIILDGSANINIPPDGYFTVDDQFQIKVSEDASSHFAQFSVNIETNTPVVYFQDTIFKLLVAPSGIFVFEGEENGQDYSGTFIKNYLDSVGFENTYANTYPLSLKGFETVFLSHGNVGENIDKGTIPTVDHTLIIQEFLENGGNVYMELGGFFSGMLFWGYPNYTLMKQLFGVSDNPIVDTENPIDSLIGVEDSPFEGILFTGSNQVYNWYIDDLEPDTGAMIPFYEYDYGNVSIMYDGSATYGHKAFYFSYALAELVDGEHPNTREEVLRRICEFFDISVGVKTIEYQHLELNVYPNPTQEISNIKYQVPVGSWQSRQGGISATLRLAIGKKVELSIYDIHGRKIRTLVNEKQTAGEYSIQLDASDLPAGIYLIRLQAGEEVFTEKLVVMK